MLNLYTLYYFLLLRGLSLVSDSSRLHAQLFQKKSIISRSVVTQQSDKSQPSKYSMEFCNKVCYQNAKDKCTSRLASEYLQALKLLHL